MIYKLQFDRLCFQSIFTTLDFDSPRFSAIRRRWDQLEDAGVRFHMVGIGSPITDSMIRKKLGELFEDYPDEMAFGEPPRKPAEVVSDFHRPALAFSSIMQTTAPLFWQHLEIEGVMVDYPYKFSLKRIRDWLTSEEVLEKWPQLKDVNKHPVEIEQYGSKEVVYDPIVLENYCIHIYYCTNWQPDLVDRELTNGQWHTWDASGACVKYYKVDPGAKLVVFKRMPLSGTWLFRIPEEPSSVFCTQDFKEAYEANGLNGLIFKPMALSESYVPPPLVQPPAKSWNERA